MAGQRWLSPADAEWLSWKTSFKESVVWFDLYFCLISAFGLGLFWVPLLACLTLHCFLFAITFHLPAFLFFCVSIPLCFALSFFSPHPFMTQSPFPAGFLMLPVLCLQAVRLLLESIHTYRLQQRIETVLEGCKQYSVNHDQIVKPESDHHILKCILWFSDTFK